MMIMDSDGGEMEEVEEINDPDQIVQDYSEVEEVGDFSCRGDTSSKGLEASSRFIGI
jgi:hypothetical protein